MFVTVPAEALRRGDYCMGSRTRILANRGAGIDTPSGKVDLRVQRSSGAVVDVTWGKRTRIQIEREDEDG